MWPPVDSADEQTLAAEAFVEELYGRALRRWVPALRAAVLPTLDATIIAAGPEGELPPDPEAVANAQSEWEGLVASIIVPGIAQLWTRSAAAMAAGLGAAATIVGNIDDIFADTRDDFLLSYGVVSAAAAPGMVRDGLNMAIRDAGPTASRSTLRSLVRKAVTPGSELLRKVARHMGHDGAGILNHALMSVAERVGAADRKYWLSRRDSQVRDTHRVADGQVAPLDGTFTVGGADMAFPGDPRGPAREVFNCRCRLVVLAVGEAVPEPWGGEDEPLAASAANKEDTMSVDTETPAEEMQPDTTLAVADGEVLAVEAAPVEMSPGSLPGEEVETYRTFTDAVIAFIGTPTSDYRMIAKEADVTFRAFPLAMTWMKTTGDGNGHSYAATVGVMESGRIDEDKVLASGYLLNTPEADEAAKQLEHGVTRPSIELGRDEWYLTTADGEEFTEEMWWNLPLFDQRGGRPYKTWTAAELIGMCLVPTPAFGDTQLILNAERESRDAGLVAAAVAPRIYPATHFADPQLSQETDPTMDDDGHVYGHLAFWESCHRSVQDQCVLAPHSPTNYSHFHTSPAVRLDDGTRLPVGKLTVGTGHAAGDLAGIPAQAHYDNTGACWALVRVGEDAHGIWFSGVTAPWASVEQIEAGLCSSLSGDWRDFGQGLELVAALSVNTAGFVARGRSDQLGRPVTLVAALGRAPQAGRRELTRDDIKAAVAEAMVEQRLAAERDAKLAAEIAERDAALARAAKLVPLKTPREQIGELLAKASAG